MTSELSSHGGNQAFFLYFLLQCFFILPLTLWLLCESLLSRFPLRAFNGKEMGAFPPGLSMRVRPGSGRLQWAPPKGLLFNLFFNVLIVGFCLSFFHPFFVGFSCFSSTSPLQFLTMVTLDLEPQPTSFLILSLFLMMKCWRLDTHETIWALPLSFARCSGPNTIELK